MTKTSDATSESTTTAAPPGPPIVLDNVSKVFGHAGDPVHAVDRIDLQVARSEFVCLLGASGCGKSTLLNLVAGLDRPTDGSVHVEGRVAVMFQEPALFPWLTVAANVELPLRLAKAPKDARRERVLQLLDLVNLRGFERRRPHELSGGMRQRVALARAMAQDADVLLMDEPFGALDAMTRDLLHDELERLWDEAHLTILFVTHNVREAVRLGDRVVLLTSRPGTVAVEFPVEIDRPRRIESHSVADLAATITDKLRARRSDVMAKADAELRELSRGLDQLEFTLAPRRSRGARIWAAFWPKVAALALVVLVWQSLVWLHWKPEVVLPPPWPVFEYLFDNFGDLVEASLITMQRAAVGFGLALVIGTVVGALVARIPVLRTAIGSLLTGLQTMPSVAWFPFAILVFQLSEGAITFVVVLGAAPSIANGLIGGIDHIPPLLLRTGRVLGVRGTAALRHVVLPAALPSFFGGIKQGWAFAWRSLLAGELLAIIPGKFSLGQRLQFAADFSNARGVIAIMIVILVIGVLVDSLVFGNIDRAIRRRYGLLDQAAE